MRLVEMKAHYQNYRRHLATAREAASHFQFDLVVERAEAAIPFLAGMCRYVRKKEQKERVDFHAVELVLRHAPLILDGQAISRIADFHKANRSVFKYSARDVPEALSRSRDELRQAFELWSVLDTPNGTPMQAIHRFPSIEKRFSQRLVEAWFHIGLLQLDDRGAGQRVYRNLRIDHSNHTRCRHCGVNLSMSFDDYLASPPCPHCGGVEGMVLIESAHTTAGGN
ncbi:MAG: hypothetical protein NT069_05160 [Planctomycetota bacterium]|nr:hypothetical protein [Planctomycetota bacterium]